MIRRGNCVEITAYAARGVEVRSPALRRVCTDQRPFGYACRNVRECLGRDCLDPTDRICTETVPGCVAAVAVMGADAGCEDLVEAADVRVPVAAVSVARTAVIGAGCARLCRVACPIATRGRARATVCRANLTGLRWVAGSVATAGPTAGGLDLADTDVVPGVDTAVVVDGADTGFYRRFDTTWQTRACAAFGRRLQFSLALYRFIRRRRRIPTTD